MSENGEIYDLADLNIRILDLFVILCFGFGD